MTFRRSHPRAKPQGDKAFYQNLTKDQPISIRVSKDPKTQAARGRGVFADQDFEEGEIVFVDEPFVSLADSSHEVGSSSFSVL